MSKLLQKKVIALNQKIPQCKKCPRLIAHCKKIAQEKRKSYADQNYWGKPVPSFGDPAAEVMILGLAPAAHGANRTGRMFTGDRSGDWLYRALFRAGFANQPESVDAKDGLQLINAYISAAARCAPPDNKPTRKEIQNCLPYLEQELALMPQVKVLIALGGIALNTLWPMIAPVLSNGKKAPRPKFGHAEKISLNDGRILILSYHPSQQNTFTGRLTEPMFDQVFKMANHHLKKS